MLRKISIIIAAVAIFLLSGCGAKTISTMGMVEVVFDGLNADGTATATINSEKLTLELKKIGLIEDEINSLILTFKISLSQDSKLKNGDKITSTVAYDENLAKRLKVNIETAKEEFEVSGLKDSTVINLMDNIQVSFRGYNGKGSVEINPIVNDTPFLSSIEYIVKPSYTSLKNGDILTIYAIFNEKSPLENGIIVEEVSRNYTVNGLGEKLTDDTIINESTQKYIDKIITFKLENPNKQIMGDIYVNSLFGNKSSSYGNVIDTYSDITVEDLVFVDAMSKDDKICYIFEGKLTYNLYNKVKTENREFYIYLSEVIIKPDDTIEFTTPSRSEPGATPPFIIGRSLNTSFKPQ